MMYLFFQLLLWSRASARVLNINNQSPIDIAAQRGHHIAVRLLHVSYFILESICKESGFQFYSDASI